MIMEAGREVKRKGSGGEERECCKGKGVVKRKGIGEKERDR